MSKIAVFDRVTAKQFHSELNKALTEVASKYGLSVKPTTARFDVATFSKKVVFKLESLQAQSFDIDAARSKFENAAFVKGFDSSLFGKTVLIAGKRLKVVGWNGRSYAKPIKLKDEATDRNYKCNVAMIKSARVA